MSLPDRKNTKSNRVATGLSDEAPLEINQKCYKAITQKIMADYPGYSALQIKGAINTCHVILGKANTSPEFMDCVKIWLR